MSRLLTFLKTTWYFVNSFININAEKRGIYRRSSLLSYIKFIKSKEDAFNGNLDPLDVFIPVIERDLETLALAIPSIRMFCRNPIINIFLVAPQSQAIRQYAKENNCIFIDEASVLPEFEKFDYTVGGENRANWLLQQFLKLNWDQISKSKYCLIFDADTVLIKKHSFVRNQVLIFNCSEEYHQPYFETFNRLLKIKIKSPISFVSHFMVFERETTRSLKSTIEKLSQSTWVNAIINNTNFNENSGFSEYETYGHYMMQNFRKKVRVNYYGNLSLKRENLSSLSTLIEKYAKEYFTVSFHWHQ